MRLKKIVGFGDSWIWGDELLDPALKDHPQAHPVLHLNTPYRESRCFLGQLGQHYNLPTENFGIAGGSLQSSIWTYLWWIKHETVPLDQCLVLIGLTDPNRMTFYNPNHKSYSNDPPWNRFVHSAWVWSGATCLSDQWVSTVKDLFVLSDCNELRQLNYEQTVRFFHGQSSINGGNVLQFNTIMNLSAQGVDNLLWPDQSLSSLLKAHPDHHQYIAPNRHPNEMGHEFLSKQLISYIDSCIMYAC